MSEAELLTIMIETTFLDSIVGNNWFQSIFGLIDHNSMNVTLARSSVIVRFVLTKWEAPISLAHLIKSEAAIQPCKRTFPSWEGPYFY